MTLPADLFPSDEFDDWAETYDNSVAINQFPFYGYVSVLDALAAAAELRTGLTVLDLGTGTGNLAERFARAGCELWCLDFSAAMLEKALVKLPAARFCLHDLRKPWPQQLEDLTFDRIVSAYVFHHFQLDEKIRILKDLCTRLSPGGRILIADIAFPDAFTRDAMKTSLGQDWEDEFYWLADETLATLQQAGLQASYRQVSDCAGVFIIQGASAF